MFEIGEAYEKMMGRWSRQLAPLFLEFVGVRDGEKVLDLGCGTGSLSATLTGVTRDRLRKNIFGNRADGHFPSRQERGQRAVS